MSKKIFANINWKIYFGLLIANILSVVAALPYLFVVQQEQLAQVDLPTYTLVALTLLQSTIMFAIVIFLGLKFSAKVGLGLPTIKKRLAHHPDENNIKHLILKSILFGVLVAMAIIMADFIFSLAGVSLSLSNAVTPAWWKSLLISFYGGIAEETLLRLFFMSFLLWLFSKIKKSETNILYRPVLVWSAIIIAAIVFGLGHLPVTASMAPITAGIVARAIILNGIGGIVFGWLFWKKGLEMAIIAHFSADIVLHVIFPIFTK